MNHQKKNNIVLLIIIALLLVIILLMIVYFGRYGTDAGRQVMAEIGLCAAESGVDDGASGIGGDQSGTVTVKADGDSHIYLGGEYRCSGESSVVYGYSEKAGLTSTADNLTFRSELWVSAAGNRGRVLNVSNSTVTVTLVPETPTTGIDATSGITLVIAPGTFKKFSFTCDNVTAIEVNYQASCSGVDSAGGDDDKHSMADGDGSSSDDVEIGSDKLVYRIYSEDEQYGGKFCLRINVEWNYDRVKNLGAYYCIFKFYDVEGKPLTGLHDVKSRKGRSYKSLGYPVAIGVEGVFDEQYYQDFGIRVPYEQIKEGYGPYSREEVKAFFYRVFVCDNPEANNPIYTYKSSLIQLYP